MSGKKCQNCGIELVEYPLGNDVEGYCPRCTAELYKKESKEEKKDDQKKKR